MKCIYDTTTSHLMVLRVFDTGESILGFRIYYLATVKTNGKATHRFGTWAQIKSILKPYRFAVADKEGLQNLLEGNW